MINIVQDERYGSILLTPAVIEESDATEGGHPDA
jgi:hypothetical protein